MALHLSSFHLSDRIGILRKAALKKKKEIKKYVPYIPPHLVAGTVKFLEKKENIKNLLNIICAPLKPEDDRKNREEYTRKLEYYKFQRAVYNAPYRQQEKFAEIAMWSAVNNLPSDLYAEAVAESRRSLPLKLRPHWIYRGQFLNHLTDYEQKCLQVYQNLMALRYPFSDVKASNPGLFWITQLGSLHRARLSKLCKSIVRYGHK